jgi:hypothetical protein
MHYQTLSVLAFALFLLSPASSAEAEERLSLELPPARWQLLPEAVRGVYVGPDGRAWYQLDSDPHDRSAAQIRNELENEFRQPFPQIKGAAIALLEPGGRVWFYVNKAREAWGYDGEKWIDRKTQPASRFVGSCLTRGQLPDNLSNRSIGGKTWLRDDQGIHIFDGQRWSYMALCPPLNTVFEIPRLAVSPSGKCAVAMTPKSAGRSPVFKTPDLWLCENADGNWQKLPIAWADREGIVGTFTVTDEGRLWFVQGGLLRVIAIATTREAIDRLPQLISQLDDDNAQLRQRSQEALAEMAEQIQPQLQSALKTAESPEKKRRLEALIDQVRNFKSVVDLRPGNGIAVGAYRVQHAKSIFQDDDGKRFIFANSAARDNNPAVNGLLTVSRDGNSDFVPLGDWFHAEFSTPTAGRGPIRTPQGDALWMSGASLLGQLACRIDVQAKRVTAHSPDSQFGVVRAVDEGGRVFLARREQHPLNNVPFGLGRLAPEIADSRPVLKVTHTTGWPEFVVASDGAVWTLRKGTGLSRYDGQNWALIHPEKQGFAGPALAGCDNIVLCRGSGNDYLLFQDNKLVAIAPLRKLIAAYREKFAAAFPPQFTPLQRQFRFWIATDTQKNIWLAEGSRISVYCGDDWVETIDAINAAPGARTGGGPAILSAAGNGSKVYFSLPGNANKGESFLAEIRESKVILKDAPHGPIGLSMDVGFRDREGGFWVPGYAPDRPAFTIKDRRTVRLGESGPLQTFTNNVWPVLVDRSENVWLAEMGLVQAKSRFSVWRDGKIVQELDVPGADELYGLVSDQPGSVYAWTTLGLHHFVNASQHGVNANQHGPAPFRLAQTYSLPALSVFVPRCAYSERAGLIIPTKSRNQQQLSMISLPEN